MGLRALGTVDNLKDEVQVAMEAHEIDDRLERLLLRGSGIIDNFCGHKLLYSGGGFDADIVAKVSPVANGALTIANQPAADYGRTVAVEIVSQGVNAGTVTFTGKDHLGATITEVYDIETSGREWDGLKIFASITSIVVANISGVVAADSIRVRGVIPIVEYHTIRSPETYVIWSRESPIVDVSQFHESTNRLWDQSEELILGTDYVLAKREGRLSRIATTIPYPYLRGVQILRLVYTAGFRHTEKKENIPGEVTSTLMQLCAFVFREIENKNQGVNTRIDLSGAVTRFATHVLTGSHLTKEMRGAISTHRRMPVRTIEGD